MNETSAPTRRYEYEECRGACPHRRLYDGPEATVWTCPANMRVWTDPMRGNGWGFRITFGMDVDPLVRQPIFEWVPVTHPPTPEPTLPKASEGIKTGKRAG